MVCGAFDFAMTLWTILVLFLTLNCPTSALKCFDSTMAEPHHTVRCAPGQSCYDEYYAFNTSKGHIRQHFDRFCVFQAHCSQRGIDNGCLTLDELDEVVQRTFYEKIKTYDKINRDQIFHSRFCCCEQDGCNSFSASDSLLKFNITSTSESARTYPWSLIAHIISLTMSFCVLW